jgi:microcystin-dependent protein
MADPFVAEIRMFGFNFAPRGWATCDGQIMPLSQNTALFALLGTTYGGDGKSTFALPDLQARAPMHPGQGPGLSGHMLGESGGSESVTLDQSQIPAHTHSLQGRAQFGNAPDPTGRVLARPYGGGNLYSESPSPTQMSNQALAPSGSSLPHNNMQPYLTMNFCIALQGIFPSRP